MIIVPQLEDRCAKCKRRHRAVLPCWSGKYAQRITRHVLRTQGTTCWMCGGTATTADHILARSRGGDDTDQNLRPACQVDNGRRGNTPNPFPLDPEPVTREAALSSRWET